MPNIAIVAGEASGDLLGSHLISAIKKHRPDSQFFGIAGPKMQTAGAKTLYPIERLSVRGYIEVLKHLPSLLKLRRELLKQIIAAKPDLFIGVDAPDFNFWLEKKLKKAGIPTVHYVSPSIWAWRGGRISSIKKAVSHMLALFPFEPGIYQKAGIPVPFVGHPLADELPLEPDQNAAQKLLKIEKGKLVFALLPGSRQSEVQQHSALLIKTAQLLSQKFENAVFLVPLITRETRKIFETERYKLAPEAENIQILFGHAHDAMEAADMVILASGTATLEAALLKRPMIITYKMPALSWQILKRMRYQPYVGLPNILAEKWLVPELLQKEATPEKLTQKCVEILENKEGLEQLHDEYMQIHYSLKQDSADKAAQAVLKFL